MRKIITLLLAAMMLIGCMTFSVNAEIKEKNAVGCLVYPMYVTEAPNMEPGVIDETWGDPIHLDATAKDAKEKQCGIWENKVAGDRPERWKVDTSEGVMDFYVVFDDTAIYICAYCKDVMKLGGNTSWLGDNFYLVMDYNNPDVRYIAQGDTRYEGEDASRYQCSAYVLFDDETVDFWCMPRETCSWTDVKDGFILKFEIRWGWIGISPKVIDEGCLYNFAILRNTCTNPDALGNDGFFYWGKYHDISRANGASNWMMYVADSPNAKTSNTFIFAKGNTKTEMRFDYVAPVTTSSSGDNTPATTGDTVTLKGTPSSWAKEEVEAALAADLIPEELTDGFTNGISRANLSKILSKLLDKVYGKDAEKTDAKFTDTTDADVLKAANLGIINGYEQADGTFMFKPDNTLKRSEMAAIINRVAKLCGQTVTGFDSEVTFTDTASHWCKGELGWPVHNGIVKGTSDTTFSPENTLTVEQTIMMIYRTYEALK